MNNNVVNGISNNMVNNMNNNTNIVNGTNNTIPNNTNNNMSNNMVNNSLEERLNNIEKRLEKIEAREKRRMIFSVIKTTLIIVLYVGLMVSIYFVYNNTIKKINPYGDITEGDTGFGLDSIFDSFLN